MTVGKQKNEPHTDLRVSLYLKVVVTQVALHPELEDGCGVIATSSCLLGVVAHAHSHVGSTSITPDVERELKPTRSTVRERETISTEEKGKCRRNKRRGYELRREKSDEEFHRMMRIPRSSFLALSRSGCEPWKVFSDP